MNPAKYLCIQSYGQIIFWKYFYKLFEIQHQQLFLSLQAYEIQFWIPWATCKNELRIVKLPLACGLLVHLFCFTVGPVCIPCPCCKCSLSAEWGTQTLWLKVRVGEKRWKRFKCVTHIVLPTKQYWCTKSCCCTLRDISVEYVSSRRNHIPDVFVLWIAWQAYRAAFDGFWALQLLPPASLHVSYSDVMHLTLLCHVQMLCLVPSLTPSLPASGDAYWLPPPWPPSCWPTFMLHFSLEQASLLSKKLHV